MQRVPTLDTRTNEEAGLIGRAIGIDLGTTKSVVSILESGVPTVIPNTEGRRSTPSVVGFTKTGEVLVGEFAKRQAITNPDRTVRSVGRHMGTDWTIDIDGRRYTPEEISSLILQKLKRDAEAYVGDAITDAVITVPVYFGEPHRAAVREAARMAGLGVPRLIGAPVAAAIAYGHDKDGPGQTALVFDLGGGTLDVSLVEIGDGVFEVKSVAGNTCLGGDDWDQRVVNWLISTFEEAAGIDLAVDAPAVERLRDAAELAKCELSTVRETRINLPFVTVTSEGARDLDVVLARWRLEELTEDLLAACRAPIEQAIADAGMTGDDIDHVVPVGGATRMPAVEDYVGSVTGKGPHRGVSRDEVVAAGAAIRAGVLVGEIRDVLLLDVTPLTLGIETAGGVLNRMIERNTTIPTKRSEVFTTVTDLQASAEIHVLQGEHENAADNISLGSFQLTDLPPVEGGAPHIEVTFDIDAAGIIKVSAKDRATGKEQSMTVAGGRSPHEDQAARTLPDAERSLRPVKRPDPDPDGTASGDGQ